MPEMWQPHTGPHGGKGWYNPATDEIRYQPNKPGSRRGKPDSPKTDAPTALVVGPQTTNKLPDEINPAMAVKTQDIGELGIWGNMNESNMRVCTMADGRKLFVKKLEKVEWGMPSVHAYHAYKSLGIEVPRTAINLKTKELISEGVEGELLCEANTSGANMDQVMGVFAARLLLADWDGHDGNWIFTNNKLVPIDLDMSGGQKTPSLEDADGYHIFLRTKNNMVNSLGLFAFGDRDNPKAGIMLWDDVIRTAQTMSRTPQYAEAIKHFPPEKQGTLEYFKTKVMGWNFQDD